ncbi:hypothetical protein GOQ27_09520 [Clostridium sp. D2Q-11]|uniref:Uncharacterized protein n=1 Tax=Anaeromonas frigoriresistens TaxID=2683708 RepID=A0A942Z7H4_9FIRM|nr:hypothetical protein [Anaeromonas frigoriresistens]MBS4538702.1 hypothetical protein [Anaeromonas frigoriresistens]
MGYDTLEQYKYDEIYEKVYSDLLKRKNQDNLTIIKLQELIDEVEFNNDTKDWSMTKNREKEIAGDATLQAMKHFMMEWKKEII